MRAPVLEIAQAEPAAAPELLRQAVSRLAQSADALAALGVAMATRVAGAEPEADLDREAEAVIEALGLRDALNTERPDALRALLAEVRTYAMVNAKVMMASSRPGGWEHAEPELLLSAGEATSGFAAHLKAVVAPQLDGLVARLTTPGAMFLDIGCGVAALSISMAQAWPELAVVGIEPLDPARALAHDRVRAAGLATRIEVRGGRAEDLIDRGAFDLAWLPSLFVPADVVPEILRRVHTGLRDGGWLIMPVTQPSHDPVVHAARRFRAASFGGLISTPSEAEDALRGHAFAEVRTLPGSSAAITALVVGRTRSS